MSSALLQVRQLSKSFGGVLAVSDVSFDVPVGRATSLIGPNGAGKTTIFNLITGALQADSGTVAMNGRNISGLRPSEVAKVGISRTFQDLRLFLHMTVADNVLSSFQGQDGERPWAVLLRPRRVFRQEKAFRSRALEIVKRVGLIGRANELVGNLSYAEQKLVVIARSIAMEAPLWLLDDPTSGLDTPAVIQMLKQIRSLVSEGQTVLIVEHNLRVVRDISDWILFMSDGRLRAQGTPDDILSSPELRQLYLGASTTHG